MPPDENAVTSTPASTGVVTETPATTETQALVTEPAKPADVTTSPTETKEVVDADPAKVEAIKAPEKYEFKAEEGQQFNPDVLTEFEGIARELDLSQDNAQKLLGKMAPAIQRAQQAEIVRVQTEWAELSKSDKEFGGDKLAESIRGAERTLATFGTPELSTLLKETGLNNHPEIIRAFYRASIQISPTAFVTGGLSQSNTTGSLAERLYPGMNK